MEFQSVLADFPLGPAVVRLDPAGIALGRAGVRQEPAEVPTVQSKLRRCRRKLGWRQRECYRSQRNLRWDQPDLCWGRWKKGGDAQQSPGDFLRPFGQSPPPQSSPRPPPNSGESHSSLAARLPETAAACLSGRAPDFSVRETITRCRGFPDTCKAWVRVAPACPSISGTHRPGRTRLAGRAPCRRRRGRCRWGRRRS